MPIIIVVKAMMWYLERARYKHAAEDVSKVVVVLTRSRVDVYTIHEAKTYRFTKLTSQGMKKQLDVDTI